MTVRHILKKLRERWKLLTFIVILLAGAVWWYYSKQQAAQPHYNFIKPIQADITKTLDISGVVDAKEKAQLRFMAGGKVVYLGAKEGDQVKKYQTLATIDRATLQKQMQQDLNNYMKERYDFEQDKDDYKDTAITTEDRRYLDKSQLDLNNEVLDVEMQNIAINNTVLSAPFSGILTHSPTSVTGVQLLSTDYFEVVNPDTMIFRGRVDEADISQVSVGQETTVTLDAYPDTDLQTHVSYISYTSSQNTTGTVFDVEFPLSTVAQRDQLRLGMNGDASIILDARQNVMTIPIIATKQRDNKIYVDVKTGENSVEEREIRVGLENDDKYEVLSGLSYDDEIVLPE